ncbi:hypothetical protein DPEC_G00334700 [Dallia pectoralis]|uniref:Uncharacterized protein n=1 Tax=Dallia pectoralis TaxID=75939 RepID=A0ACC2F6T0_DALPE|nr:hypothetical protein DPEC_G00334700 [Dallia pectoralis]
MNERRREEALRNQPTRVSERTRAGRNTRILESGGRRDPLRARGRGDHVFILSIGVLNNTVNSPVDKVPGPSAGCTSMGAKDTQGVRRRWS